MDHRELALFVRRYFSAFRSAPVEAPIELARHLVLGAVEYARGLGFEPAPDFEPARTHLGAWQGPSAIGFGRDGMPIFVEGPHDDGARIVRTLESSVGRGNFHLIVSGDAKAPRAA